MIEFTAESVKIFGFAIYYYGMILMAGAIAGVILASHEAKRRGMDVEFLWDSVPWVLFGGIVGARLWHIFTPPPSMVAQGITTKYYLTHPLDALNLRAGGLGIPGAVIGGALLFHWFAKRKGQTFAAWSDILAPALALGQGIGRWGNFINQELYGAPSNLPWAIFISPENRLPEFASFDHYHPIFLYESLWSLGTVVLLLWLSRKFSEKLQQGDLFLVYLMTYPTVRILLEFLRLDASEIRGINANQTIMAFVLITAVLLFFFRRYKRRSKDAGIDDKGD